MTSAEKADAKALIRAVFSEGFALGMHGNLVAWDPEKPSRLDEHYWEQSISRRAVVGNVDCAKRAGHGQSSPQPINRRHPNGP